MILWSKKLSIVVKMMKPWPRFHSGLFCFCAFHDWRSIKCFLTICCNTGDDPARSAVFLMGKWSKFISLSPLNVSPLRCFLYKSIIFSMYPPAFIHHFVYYMLCFPFLSSQKTDPKDWIHILIMKICMNHHFHRKWRFIFTVYNLPDL